MRKIIVGEFVSLDGVMQAPGGVDEDTDGGFDQGGWAMRNWHDDLGPHIFATIGSCDALLVGRKTWQTHGAAFEPMPEEQDPFAGMRKYVVSTTLKSADAWRNSMLISDNVVEAIRQIKAEAGKDIYVDGSSVLVHTLARHNLVDEYKLLVFPLILGKGKRLFPDGWQANLELLSSQTFPNGVVSLHYQPRQMD